MTGKPSTEPTRGVTPGGLRWRLAEEGETTIDFDGSEITDADFDAMIERYMAIPPEVIAEKILSRGRPLMGSAPAKVVPVRLEPELMAAVVDRANSEGCNRSEVIRAALRAYLD